MYSFCFKHNWNNERIECQFVLASVNICEYNIWDICTMYLLSVICICYMLLLNLTVRLVAEQASQGGSVVWQSDLCSTGQRVRPHKGNVRITHKYFTMLVESLLVTKIKFKYLDTHPPIFLVCFWIVERYGFKNTSETTTKQISRQIQDLITCVKHLHVYMYFCFA